MSSSPDRRGDLWTLFAATWAASVLFHLAGNPRLAPEWGRGLLGATAVLVLARPRNPWLTLPLSAAVLTNVWLEAPLLANHWLLHGFLAVIVAVAVLTRRGRAGAAMAAMTGPARLLLLAFYGFAAFAKLNGDFFEPAVSCAAFYLEESAGSWGLDSVVEGWSAGANQAVAVVVASVELAVPVLLALRRTRRVGVLLGLVFHFVLALDRAHQFFDFSSVLFVLFLLFLDESTRGRIVTAARTAHRWATERWESGPELAHLVTLALLGGVVVFAAGSDDWSAPRDLPEVGVWVWIVVGLGVIGAVATTCRTQPPTAEPLVESSERSWLLLIPLLAVGNGLTPYLELKSGYGWNMYSNLTVVDGESNHYLVRSGLPITDGHERLVDITDTTEPGLEFYIRGDWLLPEVQLTDYLAARPGAEVTGTVEGETVVYHGGGDARPTWRQKFQVFRAVSERAPTACQPAFGPAR